MGTLTLFIVFCFACSYATKCLLLEQKESHEGPFKFNVVIHFPDTSHSQQACLWDRIRNLFGVYTPHNGDSSIWVVNNEAAERWTCPFCLGFWISFFFCVPFCIYTDLLILYPVFHLSMSSLVTVFIGLMNYALQL